MARDIKENIVYSGEIFEVIQQKKKFRDKIKIFEIARRSPGVRLIIIKNNKMLITKEFRLEHGEYDYRLPGGKVFDTLKEFSETISKHENIMAYAMTAAKAECIQETGLMPKKIKHYQTTKAGATVDWDLYYFIITDFEKKSQHLEDGEDIKVEWKKFDEVKKLCIANKIKEDRSVGIILKYFESLKKN